MIQSIKTDLQDLIQFFEKLEGLLKGGPLGDWASRTTRSLQEMGAEMQDSADVVKEVDDLFGKLSKDGTWNDDADRAFVRSVSRMSQAGQVRELAMLAAKINKGELKRVRGEPQVDPCKQQAEPRPCKQQKPQK